MSIGKYLKMTFYMSKCELTLRIGWQSKIMINPQLNLFSRQCTKCE